jgi:hypothetical protein
MNKFAVVGLSGVAICVVCLTGALAIGGKALRDGNFDFGGWDRPRCDFESAGKSASRGIAWDGGDTVKIGINANVQYRPGSGDEMQVTGDPGVISHVRVKDGNIRLDCRGSYPGDRLEITLPGRPFDKFEIGGAAHITLNDLDQPNLRIEMGGANQITATGKTGDLHLEMGGANQANLGELVADKARIEMGGSNEVDVAAKNDLSVTIGGAGKVRLHMEPRHLDTHIGGSGEIIHSSELDKSP